MSLDKEQLIDFIEDLKLLSTRSVIEHTELDTLKQLLKTENIKEYLDIVPQVKPESAMSDKIITPLLEALGINVSPQVNTGSSWVDYAISINNRNPVGLEVKPMFEAINRMKNIAKLKANKLDDIFDKLRNEFTRDKKNQITLYLRKYDYIIFTNGTDVFYFNRDAESDFNYFYRESFAEFVEKIMTNRNIHDVVAKIEEEKFIGKKQDLDKEFFRDLENWYTVLSNVKWKGDENEINRMKIALLNKLIFVQTLEDYSLVPFKIMINEFEDKEQKWKTKGQKKVVKEFMKEINSWFYTYYDTELFKENILEYLEDSEKNYSKFLDILKSIIGLSSWEVAFRKGLGHYNYRYIDEDIFGKAYETFLAENRKEEGIYYTPKDITGYMAESIVDEVFKEDKDKLIELLSHNPTDEEFEEAKRIVRRLISRGIIDIASGSGSFLIKALRKTYGIYEEINKATEWVTLGAKNLDEPEDVIAFKKKILEIRKMLGMYGPSSSFRRRLVSLIILRHIYGIDLDRGAVEVAKANLWKEAIKLNPDVFRYYELKEDTNHVLPNLTTNLIHGNSILIASDDEIVEFISKNFKQEIAEMMNLRGIYLTNPEDPEPIDRILEIKEKVLKTLKENLSNKEDMSYTVFYPLEFPQFYFDKDGNPLPKEERGFSGIIGNPPYIQLQNDGGRLADLYEDKGYETFTRTGDIYILFYERAVKLLKENGYLCYITSNKWMRAGYGDKLRKFLKEKTKIKEIIDLCGYKIFENVTVDTNIAVIGKAVPDSSCEIQTISIRNDFDGSNLAEYIKDKVVLIKQSELSDSAWTLADDKVLALKKKIENVGKPLKDWDVGIYYGIKTGFNEAFIIDSKKRDEILQNCEDEDEVMDTNAIIKSILRGRDIGKYYYKWAGLWVIFIPWHFPLHKDESIQGASKKAEEEFQKQFPAVYHHLSQYKDALSKRNKDETGIRYEWYALQRCANTYYPEFEKEKVVWIELVDEGRFCFVEKGIYTLAGTFIMTGNFIKYICSCLNTRISSWYFDLISTSSGVGTNMWKKYKIETLPIPPIAHINEPIVQQIETLVDQILAKKKSNPGADTSDLEKQIDELVYQLYGLTEEEIKTIEDDQDNANT